MPHDDVPDHDMNENLFPIHGREPVLPSDDAEKLLRGEPPAAGTTPEVLAVADTLGALRLPPSRGELAGEQAAVAAFAAAAKEKALAPAGSPEPRRRSMLSALTGAKLAVAAVAGSLALGGVSAAAVTGSLPGPLQSVAHTLGAPAAQPDGGVAADDPTESETPKASPSSTGSNGPTSFAVCWFVVHKTDGAAGGPWVDHASTDPTADPTDSTDSTDSTADPTDSPTDLPTASPSADSTDSSTDPTVDALDHGQGEWSQAFARIQTAAAASGQTVLQYCTALLANGSPRAHPSNTHSGDDHGKGSHDGENSSGKSTGKDHGSTQGGSDSGSGSGDGSGSGGDTSGGGQTSGGDTGGGGSDGSGGSGSGD